MTDNHIHPEGSPWFWKIFGGTVLGMITLLLVTLFANLRNELSDNRHELLTQINEVRADIREDRNSFNLFKERLVALEQSKEKTQSVLQSMVSLSENLNTQNAKIASLEAGNISSKEEIKTIRSEIKDLVKQIQEVREKLAALTPVEAKKQPTDNP